MKRTYNVKFKSASKKLTTPEKIEEAKNAIISEAKADSVEITDDGQIVTIEAEPERFPEVMNGVVNVFRKIDDKSEVSYKFNLNRG